MMYLVCRKDMLNNRYKTSGDYLPLLIEASHAEAALDKALDSFSEGYRPLNREFIVVPMEDATVITLRPVPQYEKVVKHYVW